MSMVVRELISSHTIRIDYTTSLWTACRFKRPLTTTITFLIRTHSGRVKWLINHTLKVSVSWIVHIYVDIREALRSLTLRMYSSISYRLVCEQGRADGPKSLKKQLAEEWKLWIDSIRQVKYSALNNKDRDLRFTAFIYINRSLLCAFSVCFYFYKMLAF